MQGKSAAYLIGLRMHISYHKYREEEFSFCSTLNSSMGASSIVTFFKSLFFLSFGLLQKFTCTIIILLLC
jgi:hypothetical protein